ncbi:hypothetical protein pb186bvf_011360 [Paramecium bursaria]
MQMNEFQIQQELINRREQFHVSIRKADLKEVITQKRVRCSPLTDIDQTDFILERWYHSLIDNFDIERTLTDIKNFLNNPDKLEMRLKRFQQFEIYSTLLMKFDEITDLSLLDSLLYILSNCHSQTQFNDMELLRRTQTMRKIICLLEHIDFQYLQKHVFFLLGNLIGFDDGRKVQILVTEYNIINVLVNMWINQIILQDLHTTDDYLWFLENFIHYDKNNCVCLSTLELKHLLPIYFTLIRSDNAQIVASSLRGIRSIITQKEKTIEYVVQNSEVLQILFDRCGDSHQEVQRESIQTTMALLLGDNQQESTLFQRGILNLMEIVYVKYNDDYKQMVIWGLGNVLTSQRTENILRIIHSGVFRRVLDDFHNLQTEKLRSEVMMMFRGFKSIDNEDLMRMIIMHTKLVDVLIDVLSESYDHEQIISALQIIKNMHQRTQSRETNLAQNMFEIKGIKRLLDYLSLKDNQEIQYLTLELQEQYYD